MRALGWGRGTGRGEGSGRSARYGSGTVGGASDRAVEQWEGLQIEQWNSGRGPYKEQWEGLQTVGGASNGRGCGWASSEMGGVD